MARLLHGGYLSQAVCVAARLGIADMLHDGPLTAGQLAERARCDPDALLRLLRALAAAGLLEGEDDQAFALTEVGELLREGVPGSMRAYALVVGELHYAAWGQLVHTIETGESAFAYLNGHTFMEHLQQDSAASQLFTDAMRGLRERDTLAFVDAYDFSSTHLLVDVGGANGALMGAILTANPHLRGILLDRPPVAEAARRNLTQLGLIDRCEVVGGDFLASVPPRGDAYLLSRIIQGLDDARAVELLVRCREAMVPGGRVIVSEVLVDNGDKTLTRLQDLQMLVVAGGGLRTDTQHRALMEKAGLHVTRVLTIAAPIPHAIVEAVA